MKKKRTWIFIFRTGGYAKKKLQDGTAMNRILLVEDDRTITENLILFLQKEGFLAEAVRGQAEAADMLAETPYDLVLLDISLENGNGFAVCRMIQNRYHIPVIFLTASGDEYSVEAGFDAGAEDYIAKPFRPRELLSRIRHALQKKDGAHTVFSYRDVSLDAVKGTVTKGGKELYLSALEYRLLLIFFRNMGTVLCRTRLLEEIWDAAGDFVNDNTLTVYIKRLREKIEDDPQNPQIIKTVRGLGYKV